MKEQEAIKIAIDFLASANIEECAFDSIRFMPKSDTSPHDYWSVVFAWEESEDYVDCPGLTIVEVNDSTGEASLFDTL